MSLHRREFLILAAGAAGMAAATGATGVAAATRRSQQGRSIFDFAPVGEGLSATRGQSTGGNVLLIAGEGEAMLVDAKFAGLGPALRREAEARAGEEAAITHLLNTHHHADHTGGNHAFGEDVEIHAHALAEPRILDQFERYLQQLADAPELLRRALDDREDERAMEEARGLAEQEEWEPRHWRPTSLLQQPHREVEVGGVRVRIHHFGPGHTDNDLVVHLPEQNVVHTGDLVFHGLHPYVDPPGGADSKGWIESLERVLELTDEATIVVPGHGTLTNRSGIRKQIEYFGRLREAALLATRRGDSREQFLQTDLEVFEGLEREQLKERALGAVYDEVSEENG